MAEIQNHGNILSVPAVPLPYNTGVGKLLFDKMVENKDSVAQIDGLTGQKHTYGAILQRSIRTAITMRSKGITPKDIITVCSSNHLNTKIPIIASLFLGVKTASIDPTQSLTDAVFLLNQVRPKMIFVSPNGIKLIEETLNEMGIDSEIVVFGETDKHSKFSEFLLESPKENSFSPIEILDLNETVSVFFSSGTSGMPKGICVSHFAALSQIPSEKEAELFNELQFLSYSSPSWISSFGGTVMGTVTKQCRIVLPSFDPSQVCSIIEKYKITFMFLSLSQVAGILNHGNPNGLDLLSVKFCVIPGAPISKEKVEGLKKLFPGMLVFSRYGLTELGGGGNCFNFKVATNPKDLPLLLKNPTSCGKPQAGYACKIVDPETEEILGVNQKGELRIKTKYQMSGYYNLDSSEAWDKDGFLKTGDIAYYDEDYCFYIVDRFKEMLKFRSWQIAPAKLEGILMTHPAIESAVVVGLPHPADGDHPLAIVVFNKSGIKTTPEEIEKYVEERVDDRKRLRGGVKIVESLHVTPSGKFKRKLMKDLILAGKF